MPTRSTAGIFAAVTSDIRTAAAARKRLATLADPEIARHSQRFFKTGPGEYGEGDVFRGIRLPDLRSLARRAANMPLGEVVRLLRSRHHEDRLLAVILMVARFTRGDDAMKRRVAEAYLANTRYINNWDIVDVSAAHVLGAYFYDSPARLRRLARSRNLWERRMAVIATSYFIRKGECDLTFALVEQLLPDKHDLIHKACGWMLRDVGRHCGADKLRGFLRKHVSRMPRTMLRYAIEHFSPDERVRYLRGFRVE